MKTLYAKLVLKIIGPALELRREREKRAQAVRDEKASKVIDFYLDNWKPGMSLKTLKSLRDNAELS